MRNSGVILAVLASLAAMVGLFLYVRGAPPASAPMDPKTTITESTTEHAHPHSPVRVGDTVIVGNANSENRDETICMVREMSDADAVRVFVENRDHEGMRQLMGTRRASLIANRTPATLLELGESFCRVRIVQGENRGREGWISAEFLLREAP